MSEEMHQAASKPKSSDSLTVNMKVAGVLEKPCLGQPFQLGMLYDCCSDALIPGVTLWGSEALSSAVSKKPFETSDFKVVTEDSLREKMLHLDIDPSLEISILSGMVHVQGAAKFLNDRQSSRRQARVSLEYKLTTRFEQLTMDQLGNVEYTDVFDKDIATHVVTRMVYGGDAFFVFDREVGVNEDFKKIYGYLQMKVGGLPDLQKMAIREEGSIGINSGDMEEEGKLKCMFYGDVVLPKHPATFCDAVRIYQELPELFQGESIPKKVWLHPLGKLGSKAQRRVCEISLRLIDEVHTLMESLHDMTMQSNDLISSGVCSNFSGLKDELTKFKRLISSYKAHLEKSLAMLLPKVRGGGTDEAKIAEILQKNNLSPFSHQNLVTWISGKENEVKILAGYLKHLQQQETIQLAFEPGAVDVIISDLEIESVLCFDFGITWGQDALLLKMESHLSNSHDVSQSNLSAQPWYRNQALLQEMRMQLRCFIGFVIANHSKEGTKFVATNSDSKNDAENRFVSLYECCCASKFEPPDKPSKLRALNVSSTGLQLNWDVPRYRASIQFYTVSYTDDESSDQWCTRTTSDAEQQLVLSELVPGTAYCFKVRADTCAGFSLDSDVCKIRVPLDAPGKPNASNVTHDSLQLNWKKPKHGSKLVPVLSKPSVSDVNDWTTHQPGILPDQQQEHANLSGLVSKTAGPSPDSELSDPIKTLSPISQPGKPRASKMTHNCVALEWDKPKQGSDIVKHYTVLYRRSDDFKGAWITSKKSFSQENANLTGLAPKKIYTFKVRAESAAGPSPDSEVSDPIETLSSISQPGKPHASKVTHNCVMLQWDKPERSTHSIDNYTVFYKRVVDHTDGWSSFKNSSSQESANVPKLDPKTAYVFKVRAESTAGPSSHSEPSEPIETLLLFSQPGKPRVLKVTHNSVTLEWDEPEQGANNVKQYTVFYISRYFLSNNSRKWSSFRAGNSRKNVTLSKLDPRTVYVFKVRAESAASGTTTDSDLSDPIETLSSISQPGKPCALKVTHNCVTLMWNKPERGADIVEQYTIFFSSNHGPATSTHHATKTQNRKELVDINNLHPKTKYTFKVRAEYGQGVLSPESDLSNPIETLSLISQPGKPYSTKVTHESIALNWTEPKQGAQALNFYTIIYHSAEDPDNWTTRKVSRKPPKESTILLKLDPKTVYFVKIRAETVAGSISESDLSDPIETMLLPPGKPCASQITYKGFHVNWERPRYSGIQHYIVSYQATDDPPDKWDTTKTADDTPNMYFNGAEEKLYVFKVAAFTNKGISSDSELSDPIETKTAPYGAKIYKDLSPLPNSNPPTYLLPTHCVMKKNDIVKVHVGVTSNRPPVPPRPAVLPSPVVQHSSCPGRPAVLPFLVSPPVQVSHPWPPRSPPVHISHFKSDRHGKVNSGVHTGCSCHTRTKTGVRHKVLMVVGATGAGKTTLINGMTNYILGVQWDDDFRFKLIEEPNSQDQTISQTTCITAYTFYKEKGSPLPYTLTVIDTPGFGDTAGIDRDKQIVQQIKELFSIAGDEGIDQLHGIGFVTQAPLARLTPTQQYVFDAILSVFGNDVADNIFLMITFADGMKPPVLDAVEAANVPNKAFFKFNNSALFASKSAENEFDKMFWKMGTKSFDEFFHEFSNAQAQSLQLSKEVIQERETLEVTIQGLQPQIQLGLSKIDELRQERQMLKDHEAEILTNRDFTYKVEVTKQRKIDLPIGKYTTNCLTCNYTCHDDCVYNDDNDKYKCSAMHSGRGTLNAACGICPQKCSWKIHKNNPYRFELYKENEIRTSDELRNKYESAISSKEQLECVIEDMKKELDTMNMAVLRKMEQARRSVQRLQEIALKPNYLTEVEYIDLIIETEKRECKPRWMDRVKALEGVRQQAEIVTELMKNPQAEQQNVFSIEETVQEKSMWQKFLHTIGVK